MSKKKHCDSREYHLISSALGADSTIEASCPQDTVHLVGIKYFGVFNNTCFLFMTYDKVLYETAKGKCQKDGRDSRNAQDKGCQ